jgi:hypothetical protein
MRASFLSTGLWARASSDSRRKRPRRARNGRCRPSGHRWPLVSAGRSRERRYLDAGRRPIGYSRRRPGIKTHVSIHTPGNIGDPSSRLRRGSDVYFRPSTHPIRRSTFATVVASHFPPLAVPMPRPFSAAAICRSVFAPAACASRMAGARYRRMRRRRPCGLRWLSRGPRRAWDCRGPVRVSIERLGRHGPPQARWRPYRLQGKPFLRPGGLKPLCEPGPRDCGSTRRAWPAC